MAHFAKLDENNVVVIVVHGRQEDDGKEAEISARTGDTYKQTSYNTHGGQHSLGGTPLRKNFAGVGYTYDSSKDAFIPPKPYNSWILNETTCIWEAPVAKPSDMDVSKMYKWDEDNTQWVEIQEITVKVSANQVKAKLDTHEAVCAERWKETILRIKRLEAIFIAFSGATMLMLVSIIIKQLQELKMKYNTSTTNKLEELGRVDAEKAYTAQGKRNLRDEKKRIVGGLNNYKGYVVKRTDHDQKA